MTTPPPTWGPSDSEAVTTTDTTLPWWKTLLSVVRWTVVIPIVAVVIVAALPVMGVGAKINLGGILGWLLRLKNKRQSLKDPIVVHSKVPRNRVIELGKADRAGYVQVESPVIETSFNPFRDKSVVKTLTGETIQLPQGIQDHQVEEVLLIKPDMTVVRVNEPKPTKAPMSRSTGELLAALQNLKAGGKP